MSKIESKTTDGRARCQATRSYGTVWVAGRKQCEHAAKEGGLCGTHLRQKKLRDERDLQFRAKHNK